MPEMYLKALLTLAMVMSALAVEPHADRTVRRESIDDHVGSLLGRAFNTSRHEATWSSAARARRSARIRRTPEPLRVPPSLKTVWHFINGIAKPFLKTYLAPIQMLFTFMSPRMFLRDCWGGAVAPASRALSPFTIGPTAQRFFVCAVDIIAHAILCIKLLANMTPSIF